MKKLSFVLILLLSIPMVTFGYDAKIDGIYYSLFWDRNTFEYNAVVTYQKTYLKNQNTIYSSDYSGTIVVPSQVTYEGKTYTVTGIGNYAFANCGGLTSVTIPNSVTSIGNDAFSGCSSLTFITIPSSVTSINSYAFQNCRGLTSIIIGSGVTRIGKYAFKGCSGLTSVTIPESVTSIGDYAFGSCYGLTSIKIEEGNTTYDSRNNCNAIIRTATNTLVVGCKNTTIPNSVTSIGNDAFSGCSSLTFITIPSSVTSINSYAFSGCCDLTSVTIPESVTKIGSLAFKGCHFSSVSFINNSSLTDSDNWGATLCDEETSDGLLINDDVVVKCRSWSTNVTIPEEITTIGNYAFSGCNGLTFVNIPESVTTIGEYAFQNCSALTSVIIPESVTDIGNYAFSGCHFSLASFVNNSSLTNNINWGATLYDVETNDGLLINGGTVVKCRSWATSVTISNDITSIGVDAFLGCNGLQSVTLNNNTLVSASRTTSTSMESIFGSQVEEYVIGDAVTRIGHSAFSNCTNLKSITIANSVTRIDDNAFNGCSSLTNVTIPNGVISIGSSAFRDCLNLESVTIPNSVTGIGNYAFYGCGRLKKVIVPDIAAWCNIWFFDYNSNPLSYAQHLYSDDKTEITSLVIPENVTKISSYAFYGCSSLNSINIPDNVTNIYYNAFYGCYNAHFFANRGSDGLLSIWNYGTDPYEVGTSLSLPRPSVSVTSTTQATIKYHINNIYPELEYNCNYDNVVGDNEYLIKGLRPDYNYSVNLVVKSANNTYNTTAYSTTLPITPMVISSNVTASSISASGDYIQGDAKVISTLLTVDGKEITGVSGAIHGLEPNTSYNCSYMVVVEYGEGDTYTYADSKSIRTADLTLTTQQPKVISEGNVIVAAQSNLDDEETNVGFEWRRTDWTDDFDSKTGGAYLYEGMMEGYIRSLNSRYLWKFRPFYTSNAGNSYYGDWKGMDPSDYSYFEPTVYTYSSVTVQGNSAEVKGYAMRGTDNVTSQGFMYWPGTNASSQKKVSSVPANATMVLASGNVMIAKLENLEYETEYCYVAFIKISEGETFYGEPQLFKTGEIDPDGIKEIESLTPALSKGEGEWYDLNGRKLAAPKKGVNIIRYSDGTTRKVMVK